MFIALHHSRYQRVPVEPLKESVGLVFGCADWLIVEQLRDALLEERGARLG